MNVIYLVIFMMGGHGITSQSIPQLNMKQCEINAKVFNTSGESPLMLGYRINKQTTKAYCVVGVK